MMTRVSFKITAILNKECSQFSNSVVAQNKLEWKNDFEGPPQFNSNSNVERFTWRRIGREKFPLSLNIIAQTLELELDSAI